MFLSDLIKVACGHSNFDTKNAPYIPDNHPWQNKLIPTSRSQGISQSWWAGKWWGRDIYAGQTDSHIKNLRHITELMGSMHACGKWWGRDIYSPVQRL